MPAEAGGAGVRAGVLERECVGGEQPGACQALERSFSLAPAPGALQALAQGLVEDGGGGGGDVEGGEAAPHRETYGGVEEGAGAVPEALLLAAEAEDHLAGEVEAPGGLAFGVGAVGPEAGLLQGLQGGGGVGDALDGEPFARAGGSLGDGRGDRGGAAVADEDLTHSGSLADAQHGTEVAWVLDVLEQDDEVAIGGAAWLRSPRNQRRAGSRGSGPRTGPRLQPQLRGHAVVGGAGHRREGLVGDHGDLYAMPSAEVFDLVPAAPLPRGADQDSGDLVRPVAQGLADRLVAVENHGRDCDQIGR